MIPAFFFVQTLPALGFVYDDDELNLDPPTPCQ